MSTAMCRDGLELIKGCWMTELTYDVQEKGRIECAAKGQGRAVVVRYRYILFRLG